MWAYAMNACTTQCINPTNSVTDASPENIAMVVSMQALTWIFWVVLTGL